jgi:hypothetical protein
MSYSSGQSFDSILTPANLYATLSLKGWSADPASTPSAVAPAAATIVLTKIPVPYTIVVTNILFVVTTGAASQSNSQVGLYNSSGVLLSASADQGTNWQAAGLKTTALAAAQTVTGGPGVFVYAAIHQGGGTPPTVASSAAATASANFSLGVTAGNTRTGTQTGHATNDLATIGTLTLANTTAFSRLLWVGVS